MKWMGGDYEIDRGGAMKWGWGGGYEKDGQLIGGHMKLMGGL